MGHNLVIAWIHVLQPTWLGNIVVIIAIFKESLVALRKGRVTMELSIAEVVDDK